MLIALSVKIAFVITVAWSVSLLLRRASADLRHFVWLAALLSLPLLAIPLPVLIETPGGNFVFVQNAALAKLIGAAPVVGGQFVLWAIWFAGAVVIGLRIFGSVARLSAITRRSQPTETSDVRVSAEIATPCTWGIKNPVILLPASEHCGWAIVHERAHIQRRDWLWQTVAHAITALFWFHPLVWLAASRLRKEAEHAADDQVLATGAEPEDYAAQLVDVARHVRTAFDGVAMVRTSAIEYRIRAIVNPLVNRRAVGSRLKMLVSAAGLALALIAAASSTPTVLTLRDKDVTVPVLIQKTEPEYTAEARAAKVAGTVVIGLVIDELGRPRDIAVQRSLDRGLDQKAVEAIRAWRFKPGQKKGKPVPVYATIQVNFNLI